MTRRIPSHLPSRLRPPHTPSQEFWHASEDVRSLYERGLAAAGYVVHVTPRTGGRPDGLLTAVRSADFDVVERRDVLFNDCGDRVAALLHLRHTSESESDSGHRPHSIGDVLLVNTHLLFPHNSNSTLIRLRESFKILEYLHEYQESAATDVVGAGGKPRRLPVVMCGDFNGTVRGSVSRFLKSQGFYSAFEACERERDPSADGPSRWISHLNHHGECVGVDHIWVLNPSKQSAQTGIGAPPPSWKTAIYAMIQAKMLERGLATNDDAFAFFDVDESLGITRDEFETAVRMLDLTGEGSPGLLRGEIETLYDDCDKDGDGLVDFGEFIRKLDVESMERAYRAIRRNNGIEEGPWDVVGDLMATAASPTVLAGFTVDEDEDEDEEGFGGFEEAMAIAASRRDLRATRATLPDAMAAGRWPEADEFDLSDHGPLTATLAPRGKARVAAEAFFVT